MDCDAGISFEYLQFTRTTTAKGIEANVLFLGHSHIFSLLSQFHTRPGKARRLMKVRSQRFFCLCASHFLDLMLIFQKQCQRSVKVLPSSAPSCHARLSPSFIPLDPRHIGLSERFEHSYVDQQTADLQTKCGTKVQKEEHEERNLCRMILKTGGAAFPPQHLCDPVSVLGQLPHEHQTVRRAKYINADY